MIKKQELVKALQLLTEEVINQDELGGCVYCGGSGLEGRYGYCNESSECHTTDCPWIFARKLLTEYSK